MPDWVSRYRISQAPEVVMLDVCVLVATVGAVCLALGLVMLLYPQAQAQHHRPGLGAAPVPPKRARRQIDQYRTLDTTVE